MEVLASHSAFIVHQLPNLLGVCTFVVWNAFDNYSMHYLVCQGHPNFIIFFSGFQLEFKVQMKGFQICGEINLKDGLKPLLLVVFQHIPLDDQT
jgi:hypothetical protein